ncbi:MAG: hypothetical protein WD825_10480 [Gemmatimonadaceae bacterium]
MTTFRTTSVGMAFLLSHLAGTAIAQSSAVLDEATLSVSERGTPIGRESFRIIRAPAPGGQVFLATGTSVLGDSKLTTRLGTDSSGVPVSYESEQTLKGRLFQRLKGQGRPGRFSVLKQTKSGESAREYVLNNGALLMDEDVFHHVYFVPIAAKHDSLVVIAPRSAQQGRFRVEDRGLENVDIAGRSIPGRRFALIDSPSALREIWVDEKGRLLKVSVPERGLVALRDDPPRE